MGFGLIKSITIRNWISRLDDGEKTFRDHSFQETVISKLVSQGTIKPHKLKYKTDNLEFAELLLVCSTGGNDLKDIESNSLRQRSALSNQDGVS